VKLEDLNLNITQEKAGMLKPLFRNKLVGSGMVSLIIKVSGAGLSYLMFVAFAHLLSERDYSDFAFAFNLAIVISGFAGFGYSTAIMRYWPKYLAQGRSDYAKGAVKMGTHLTVLGIAVVLLVGFVADYFSITASERNFFVVATLASAFCIGDFTTGVLRAQNCVVASMFPRDVLWRILAPLIAAVAVWSGYALNSNIAIYISAFVLLVLLVYQVSVIYANLKKSDARLPAVMDWAGTKKSLLPFWGAGIVFALIQQMDVVVIGFLANPGEAGAYFAAQKTAALLSLVLIAGGLATAPMMATLYEKKQTAELQRLCRQMAIAITVVTLLGFIFLVFTGSILLSIFNHNFVSAYPILLILAFGSMIDAVAGPTAYLMQMTSLESVHARLIAVIYVFVFFLQLIFVPQYGVIAAAISNAVGVIVWNCVGIYFLRKKIGIDPSLFGIFFPVIRSKLL
jgi:O-antigen/teichoic acid export membrane protein